MNALALVLFLAADWQTALPGYRYEFPRDHFSHPQFQTEWWYYTGNVADAEGRRFGFELTFFRQGMEPGKKKQGTWDVDHVWLAHLALTDISGKRFFHTERLNRSGPGLAGAEPGRIWNGNWQVRWQGDTLRMEAVAEQFQFEFTLRSRKPPVIHGENGVSQKAAGAGKASHYISLPRLETEGTITIGERRLAVQGLAWMDHEFFTHQLTSEQTGWDWMSLQFDDGSELMLYQLRRKDGSRDPYSGGTVIDAQGRARHLKAAEIRMTPVRWWESAATKARYPVAWQVSAAGLELRVETMLDGQELVSRNRFSPSYWEGAVRTTGSRSGYGYLEMTGYDKPYSMQAGSAGER
jgi:predicted secreted hydrolase